MNTPRIVTIKRVIFETPTIKTIVFHDKSPIKPGQFYMIWIPGIDEIPMSVSKIHNHEKNITFKNIGTATNALSNLKKNSKIGIRGPFGNGYTVNGKNILFIGGGTGLAMLAPAIESAYRQKRNTTVITGAKTKQELFFINRLQPKTTHFYITTDDGTEGTTGLASDIAKQQIQTNHYDSVLSCGPELMMKTLFNICQQNKIPFQASLERYMKCAVGICGHCTIGFGQRVCIEGPIFNSEQLARFPDFGSYKRDATGKKITLQ